ncbi:MAG TPA: methyltransferase domain-containing protein [Frankiaceae bacterium]|jgi:SAM-dependent methyltransferase|nr:methyltransferase domain-containing protein [Frankiaceae bacterium]
MTAYALDNGWHAERERLSSLTRLYDETTLALCDRFALAPGARCLELGAGTGTVAEALAAQVAPGGQVLAIDTDIRFLEPLAGDVLRVGSADVTAGLPEGSFDLVHARLLLEHLPQRLAVLNSMAGAAAPGGWVLVEDFDWSTAEMVDPPSPLLTRVAGACRAFMQSLSYDPEFGRRLPRALAAAGLVDIGTHARAMPVHADPGRGVPQWELLVAQLAPALLAAGLVEPAELEAFTRLCHDGTTVFFAPVMVSCWGRRPPG